MTPGFKDGKSIPIANPPGITPSPDNTPQRRASLALPINNPAQAGGAATPGFHAGGNVLGLSNGAAGGGSRRTSARPTPLAIPSGDAAQSGGKLTPGSVPRLTPGGTAILTTPKVAKGAALRSGRQTPLSQRSGPSRMPAADAAAQRQAARSAAVKALVDEPKDVLSLNTEAQDDDDDNSGKQAVPDTATAGLEAGDEENTLEADAEARGAKGKDRKRTASGSQTNKRATKGKKAETAETTEATEPRRTRRKRPLA